jgi:photosystem II stability/assembly factor-like uncharacterized protein
MRLPVLVTAVCALAVPALAGWIVQNSGTTTDLAGMSFPADDVTGYIGCSGHLLRTTDGGTTWDSLAGPGMYTITALQFPLSSATGYVVASGGKVAKTTDGGTTWVRESTGVTLDLRDVCFPVDAETGYVCGGDPGEGVILKTTNGGNNWVRQSVNPGVPISAIDFPVDARTGFAAGWSGKLLKTTDGGNNWDSLPSGTNSDLMNICFPIDAVTGYAVGGFGAVLKTTDGGASWVYSWANVSIFVTSASFPTRDTGYIAGMSGTIVRTTDGGDNWVLQNSGTPNNLWAIRFPVNGRTGYAAGYGGTIIKTTDGGIGIKETQNSEVRTPTCGPTIVRGVLLLPATGVERSASGVLLDASGRRVLDLRPGANDVTRLAPGVYFVRIGSSRSQGVARSSVQKVLVTR